MDIYESEIEKGSVKLTGFDINLTWTLKSIKLVVYAGSENKLIDFIVLDYPLAFNIILGRP